MRIKNSLDKKIVTSFNFQYVLITLRRIELSIKTTKAFESVFLTSKAFIIYYLKTLLVNLMN